jgi:YgiT-type zinc finger domain-containing protein
MGDPPSFACELAIPNVKCQRSDGGTKSAEDPMRDRCDFCFDGRLEANHVREYYRLGKGLVVMENIPAYVCNKCGERYYEAHVAKQMRKLSKKGRQTKQRISFPIVRFEGKKATG